VTHDYVTMTMICDGYVIQYHIMCQFVIVTCDIMLTLKSKSENKKINGNKNKNEK